MLSDDALERTKGKEKKRKEEKKKQKMGGQKAASGFEDAEAARRGRKVATGGMWRGMTNGFFVARHLPGAVDLKSTPFPSKPGSKATGFPFDLLPWSRALRSKSSATSFFPNGWTRRAQILHSLEMLYPRVARRYFRVGAAHHHSFAVQRGRED